MEDVVTYENIHTIFKKHNYPMMFACKKMGSEVEIHYIYKKETRLKLYSKIINYDFDFTFNIILTEIIPDEPTLCIKLDDNISVGSFIIMIDYFAECCKTTYRAYAKIIEKMYDYSNYIHLSCDKILTEGTTVLKKDELQHKGGENKINSTTNSLELYESKSLRN